MKKIIPFLFVGATVTAIAVFGLYTYISISAILITALIQSSLVGFRKPNIWVSIGFLIESVILCILLYFGIADIEAPVMEQSIVLAIAISVFLVVHICMTLWALYWCLTKTDSQTKTWDFILLFIIFLSLSLYGLFRMDFFLIISIVLAVFWFTLRVLLQTHK
jgi:hypothetical protein